MIDLTLGQTIPVPAISRLCRVAVHAGVSLSFFASLGTVSATPAMAQDGAETPAGDMAETSPQNTPPQNTPPQTTGDSPAQSTALKRQVTLEGLRSQDLRNELRDLSSVAESERSYTSLAAMRRAADGDVDRMLQALSSKGYYAAEITPFVRRDGNNVDITFEIERGPLFSISGYRISYTDNIEAERPQFLADMGIETNGDPTGDALAALEAQFVTWLEQNGYPFVSGQRHFVRANFDTGQATAVFEVATGPRATFGEPVVTETPRTREPFIAAYADWDEGDVYDVRKVTDYRERLTETGLFRQITVSPQQPGPEGETDVEVTVTERDRRTIGTGLSYATDVGPGISVFWQDRNLFRNGESLTAQADLSGPEQLVGLSFSKPIPRLPGSFNASTSARNEISDAFEAKTFEITTGLSKSFYNRNLEVSGGLGYVFTQVEDAVGAEEPGEAEQFSYFRFPARVAWNNQNDVLNPTTGFRTAFTLTP